MVLTMASIEFRPISRTGHPRQLREITVQQIGVEDAIETLR